MKNLSEKEQSFFECLFGRFDERGVQWLLLRNYEDFPARIGNDLDIYIPFGQLREAIAIFADVLNEAGGKILHLHERSYFRAMWFAVGGSEQDFIHIDFYPGAFTWHGLRFLEEKQVLEEKQRHNRYPVPRPAHEALSLAVIGLLWGSSFRETYRNRIATLLADKEERRIFEESSNAAFDLVATPDCFPAAADDQRRLAARLRKALKRYTLRKNPLRALAAQIRYWGHELRVHLNPPGLHVHIAASEPDMGKEIIQPLTDEIGSFFGATKILRGDLVGWRLKWMVWRLKARNFLLIRVTPSRQPASPRPDLLVDAQAGSAEDAARKIRDLLKKKL